MALDVVVVNYKTYDLLRDFVASWEKYKFDNCTLRVIDVGAESRFGMDPFNGQGLGYTNVESEKFIIWQQYRENIGYGRACNAGTAFYVDENDAILLANADTVLSDGLKECYDALMSHEDWGVLGPRQVNEWGQITAGGIFGTDRLISQRGWNEADRGQYCDVREDAKSVSGSLYFIKRSVWQELTDCPYLKAFQPDGVGAFLHTPHYYEETACSYHARAHGYKIVYYGPVQMTHLWHRASVVGGAVDQQADASKSIMRRFCASHNIVCE